MTANSGRADGSVTTDDDWPSQSFRDHVIHRLEPELARNRQNAPNLPVPGDARQVEEYVFQKCTSKDEYMRTIAKVINAINCNSKSAAVPSVLPSHFSNANKQPSATQLQPSGILGAPTFKPQIPPDPQPTHQQGVAVSGMPGTTTHLQQMTQMGQPPPVMTAANAHQPNSLRMQTTSGFPPNMGNNSSAPGLQPIIHSSEHQNMQYIQQYQQQPLYEMSGQQQQVGNYGMQQGRPMNAHGVAKVEHLAHSNSLDGQREFSIQQRNWNMQQNPPLVQRTGSYPQPMQTAAPFQPDGVYGMQPPASNVYNNSAGFIDYGHLPSEVIQQLRALGEEEKPYYEKICQLQAYMNMLRDKAVSFQMSGYHHMVTRIEFAMSMLRFEKIGNMEQAKGIEQFIRKLAQQHTQQTSQQYGMAPVQQSQPMDTTIGYSAAPPPQQMQQMQQNQPNQWNNWQQEMKSPAQLQPTSQHSSYAAPSSSASFSTSNRPAPYPLPSHQPKYSPGGMQQHQYNNAGYGSSQHLPTQQPMGMPLQQPPTQQHNMMRQNVSGILNPISQAQPMNTQMMPNNYSSDQMQTGIMDSNTYGGVDDDLYLFKSIASDPNTIDDLLPVPSEGPMGSSTSQMGQMESMITGGACTTISASQMPEIMRNELMTMEKRFVFDPNVDVTQDSSFIVRCSLRREQVPSLNIVIPRNYPASVPVVQRAILDLDSFYYDDLQNAIHDQLNKLAPRSITDILNTWDGAVQQFYSNSNQMAPNNFDDFSSSFGDVST